MPEEPPSILPRGTIIRPSASPRPAPPASPVYIQSVSGFICSEATAAGMDSSGGGGPPASTSATRTDGSSDNRAAITAPADPAPTTTTSNCSTIWSTFRVIVALTTGRRSPSALTSQCGTPHSSQREERQPPSQHRGGHEA